jgi:hypothetical protein
MLFGVGTHLKGDPGIAHLTFTQNSKCGGKSLSVLLQSSKHPKEYSCFKKVSDLACSKKREKKRGKERKKEERDKKRRRKEREKKKSERKKERVRESHGSTHSSSSCTQTIKNPAPLPFKAFATPLRSALAHMRKGRRTLRPQS